MNNITPYPQSHDELLSALVDGELSHDELERLLQEDKDASATHASWNTYQLIGSALRSPDSFSFGADAGFLAKFNERLVADQMDAGRRVARAGSAAIAATERSVEEAVRTNAPAANDGNFRWKMVAGFASLAAVSAIGWNALGFLAPDTAPQVAQAADASALRRVVVASPQGPIVRDARLEELLRAHKQMGGISALQVPSGFLRNATFEAPQDSGR